MTFAIENAFALAILGEHSPDTSTTKDLIYKTDLAFWRVSSRILEGNTSLPSDEADIFEGIFAFSILGERVNSGVDTNTLVASATQVYLSIRGRLIPGECVLPSPQSTMTTSRPDPSVIVLFSLTTAFPAAESDVGGYPDNIIDGETMSYEFEYSLKLAIENEQASGASQEAVLSSGANALSSIRRRFDDSNFEIPRATRLLERLFILAILREQAADNIEIPPLITRVTSSWERIAARLGRNKTPFPSNGTRNSNENADSNHSISTGSGAVVAQAVAVSAPPVMPAGAVKAAAPPRRRYDGKRGKDRYGCELCDQPPHYTSKCSLDRHKKKHHGIPTPGELRQERKLAAEAALGAQVDGDQADRDQTAGDQQVKDEAIEKETGDEMDLEKQSLSIEVFPTVKAISISQAYKARTIAEEARLPSAGSSPMSLSDDETEGTMAALRAVSDMGAASTLPMDIDSQQPHAPRRTISCRHFYFSAPQEQHEVGHRKQLQDTTKEVASYIVNNIAPEKRTDAVKTVARALAFRRLKEQAHRKNQREKDKEAEENDQMTISKTAFKLHMARIQAAQQLSASWMKDTVDSLDRESIQARIIDMSLEEIHDTAAAFERSKDPAF
ncbi:hypothetical protein BDP55DRAFT_728825 [Colletotrichum godetiae]|uniref:Uncharacterized protein n=1 Tax=Colletotrichum godetiae TaxID=1209918 RepID=A0AAJ0ALQ1_9PEZI|nr:uncharacterized protein BDP55DRAFT_728825 [Colletotrichum godetiae]KAK1675530.1 hypothetical protein BDP55DRAFT_728825 [Colletotrichum godetiae]